MGKKNITLSVDERFIEAARARVRAENSTLNEQFRLWLEQYAQGGKPLEEIDSFMATVRGKVIVGRKLTREQMNER